MQGNPIETQFMWFLSLILNGFGYQSFGRNFPPKFGSFLPKVSASAERSHNLGFRRTLDCYTLAFGGTGDSKMISQVPLTCNFFVELRDLCVWSLLLDLQILYTFSTQNSHDCWFKLIQNWKTCSSENPGISGPQSFFSQHTNFWLSHFCPIHTWNNSNTGFLTHVTCARQLIGTEMAETNSCSLVNCLCIYL